MRAAGDREFVPPALFEDLRLLQEWIMKKLLALSLVALLAGTASAELGLGLFFSDTEFTDVYTNANSVGAPFNAYLVLLSNEATEHPEYGSDVLSEVTTVGGYEVGIQISDPLVFILSVTGPNTWTNYGTSTNHIAAYVTPLAWDGDAVILATLNMLQSVATPATITFTGASPSSFEGAPGISNGDNTDLLYQCGLSTGNGPSGIVATLNGDGTVATEAQSLSSIKALFD
jgi:hypothetical protein